MVSDASKKKAAQKKAAAAAKRGGKAPGAASSKAAASETGSKVDNLASGVSDLQISDRTCTGVFCSHPLSREIRDIEESSGSSKKSRTSDGGFSAPSEPEAPTSGCSTNPSPIGRDKAKKKGKGKALENPFTKEFIAELRALRITREKEVEVMNTLEMKKIEYYRERDEKKIEYDREKEERKIMMYEKKIEYDREKEERKIMMSNRNMLMKLFEKDRLAFGDHDVKSHLIKLIF